MAEVTADFAIKYLLDDCDDCPENKDGECMTQSHCFEVKYLAIKALRQEPKTGHWIDIMVGDMPAQACDRCNTFYPLAYTGGGHNYCPNCGAKMIEPQESEDKEWQR